MTYLEAPPSRVLVHQPASEQCHIVPVWEACEGRWHVLDGTVFLQSRRQINVQMIGVESAHYYNS